MKSGMIHRVSVTNEATFFPDSNVPNAQKRDSLDVSNSLGLHQVEGKGHVPSVDDRLLFPRRQGLDEPKFYLTSSSVLLDTDLSLGESFLERGRPYFFAKSKTDQNKASVDMKSLWLKNLSKDRDFASFDREFEVFYVMPTGEKKTFKVDSLQALRNIGLPDNVLRNLWDLEDELDPDHFWPLTGRVALAALMTDVQGPLHSDRYCADNLLGRLAPASRQYALDGVLYLSSAENSSKFVELLLGLGADSNSYEIETSNETALGRAVLGGCLGTVSALLAAGANPDFTPALFTPSGRQVAEALANPSILELIHRYKPIPR